MIYTLIALKNGHFHFVYFKQAVNIYLFAIWNEKKLVVYFVPFFGAFFTVCFLVNSARSLPFVTIFFMIFPLCAHIFLFRFAFAIFFLLLSVVSENLP